MFLDLPVLRSILLHDNLGRRPHPESQSLPCSLLKGDLWDKVSANGRDGASAHTSCADRPSSTANWLVSYLSPSGRWRCHSVFRKKRIYLIDWAKEDLAELLCSKALADTGFPHGILVLASHSVRVMAIGHDSRERCSLLTEPAPPPAEIRTASPNCHDLKNLQLCYLFSVLCWLFYVAPVLRTG